MTKGHCKGTRGRRTSIRTSTKHTRVSENSTRLASTFIATQTLLLGNQEQANTYSVLVEHEEYHASEAVVAPVAVNQQQLTQHVEPGQGEV